MKKITMQLDNEYDILIGQGIMNSLGQYLSAIASPCRLMLVSDSNVFPIYGPAVTEGLEKAGFTVYTHIIPAGERSKTPHSLVSLWEDMAEYKFSRSDMAVALGGGVVGDLTGFAAATYMRGLKYAAVPTSLLAMVDSSVGGKTAVDLKAGKNLAGAFYQPCLVLCDTDALNSLPGEYFSDGMAEVIKYGMISSVDILDGLDKYDGGQLTDIIALCIREKQRIVETDEFDKGVRQLLNFGHTAGHAIERLSDYTISHGRAVAMGMHIMAKYGVSEGLIDVSVYERLNRLTEKFKLDGKCPYSATDLYEAALTDKKTSGGGITLAVLHGEGRSDLVTVPVKFLKTVFEKGLE